MKSPRSADPTAVTAPTPAVVAARAAARPTTLPLPTVPAARAQSPLMTWTPPPRRSRPGRAPLAGEAAVVGRYLQRHLDERRDDVLTARVVLSHLMPATAAAGERDRVLERATSVVCSLRQQGGPWLARVDAPCPGEVCGTRVVQGPLGPQDELCEEHWEALGGWLSVQAVHVRSLLMLAGVAQ